MKKENFDVQTFVELRHKQKRRKGLIKDVALGVVGAAGIMSVALFAPNALQYLKPFIHNAGKKKQPIYHALWKLKKEGLIEEKRNNGKRYFVLTNSGKREVQKMAHETILFPTRKKWDGSWRVLIFDIQENRAGTRDKIRRMLKRVGFKKLQNSVWVFPYPCEEFVTLLKTEYRVGKEMIYIVTNSIEGDMRLRKEFGLPLD